MMAHKEGEKVDMLKCGVCLERYRRPKLLPCFHTYCQLCVEKLAGTKPSFPCPACLTSVVIPPGGAANLQANFYLEKELAKEEAKEGRECQLCSKGKQAQYKCVQCQQLYCAPCRGLHDSIESCTQHALLPVGGEQGGEGVVMETKCAKHKNQLLLLFCCRCEVSICIQCKLTSHDGHETEDVIDTKAKAKARLQDECHSLDQLRHLMKAMLAKADDFQDDLDQERRTAEQEIRDRASQLQQMVSQAQEEAMKCVQSAVEMAANDLKKQTKPIKERHAAVVAKRQHIQHVIDEGNAEETLGLVSKRLRVETDNAGKGKSGHDNLVIQRGTVGVGYRPRAVRYTDILSFVGVVKPGPAIKMEALSLHALQQQEPVKCQQITYVVRPVIARPSGSNSTASVTEIVYSKNSKSTVERLHLTADDRVWVVYKLGRHVPFMSLFRGDGSLLETHYEDFPTDLPVTVCDGDTVLSLSNGQWMKPGGETGTVKMATVIRGSSISKSQCPVVLTYTDKSYRMFRVSSLSSLPPVIGKEKPVFMCFLKPSDTSYKFDVSVDGIYYAICCGHDISLYDMRKTGSGQLRYIAEYNVSRSQEPADVCFCQVDGEEMMLVAYTGLNSVHVVDHTDGCCFVRTVEGQDLKLDRPYVLATNHKGRVWVGCHGGNIAIIDL